MNIVRNYSARTSQIYDYLLLSFNCVTYHMNSRTFLVPTMWFLLQLIDGIWYISQICRKVQIVGGAECKAQIHKALHCGHYLTLIDYDACKKRNLNRTEARKVAQLNTPKTPFFSLWLI